jgi:transcriptional regulator with XRE-family HTH domain
MSQDTSFAELVKRRRVALGMSQAALADLIGRSASAIRGWERGASSPSDENVVQSLGAVLGIEEGVLRSILGMPLEPPFEESEEVGGERLAVFAEERLGDDDGSEELLLADIGQAGTPVEQPRVSDAESDREVPIEAGNVAWVIDETTEQVPDPESGGEEAYESLPVPDRDEETLAFDESPGQSERLGPSDDGVMEEALEVEAQAIGRGEEPADEVDSPPGGDQTLAPEPVARAAASMTSRTATVRVSEKQVHSVEGSYLDDPDQMITYWIRAALTVAFAVFLLIVLFWALGRLGESAGEVWEIFKTGA